MLYIYHLILYRPLLNILIFFYNTIAFQDLGLAIIFLTLLIRLILFPIFQKSTRQQLVMQRLQPKIKQVQDNHRGDREKQTQAIMALYKEHGVNPFSGFLLLLIQLPILIALYQIFLKSLNSGFLEGLYGFLRVPEFINPTLLGLINLKERSILIVGLAALAQYFQGLLALPKIAADQKPAPAEKLSRQMVFVGPLITVAIFYNLPAAIGLYWVVSSLFSIFQQLLINRQTKTTNGKLGTFSKKDN